AVERRLRYFGFELETGIEPLEGEIPESLQGAARQALASALLEGEVEHPDQGKVRRVAQAARELYRRSGGTIGPLADAALLSLLVDQLAEVGSWSDFLRTPLALDLDALIPPGERGALEA